MDKVSIQTGSQGPWTVDIFEVNTENSIGKMQLAMQGRAIRPGSYTRLWHQDRGVVMSDTPAEMRDHHAPVEHAKGVCLINGLGIGMVLHNILKKPEVTNVIVIEKEQDVINLVGPCYQDPRVKIICCDAMDYQPEKGMRFQMVWHDIWDTISEDNLPDMAKLHRKYGRKTDWQGSWGKSTILRERRQANQSIWRW